MDTQKFESAINRHGDVVVKGLLVGLWCSAIAMFAVMGFGLYKIGLAIYDQISGKVAAISLLSEILNALELIFVSPLVYLLMLSLLKYISAVRPRLNPDLKQRAKYIDNAQLEIITVKILSTSLFISILILHSLELILSARMTTQLIAFIGVILGILIIYYFILDYLSGELKRRIHE
jgi:hypothetical protein